MRSCFKTFFFAALLGTMCLVAQFRTGWAMNQNPNLNFGSTNIFDGILPPPGLNMLNYLAVYSADSVRDGKGKKLPGRNEVRALVYTPQLVYIFNKTIGKDLRFGITALMPIISFDLDSDLGLQANNAVQGDLDIAPIIGSHVQLGKGYVLHWFFEADTYMPTGDYDKYKALNPSANYFTFEPFLSMTLLTPSGFELSTRQFYTYNFKNTDYFNAATNKTGTLQAGQLYHFNYSLTKNIPVLDPGLRIGVVGYYGKQLTEDEFDDQDIKNSKEQVFAIGPGLVWIHKGLFLGLKVFYEDHVEARAQGVKTFVQIRFKF